MTYFFSLLRIADIYRYDLNDKILAVNYYSQALSQLNKGMQLLTDSKPRMKSAINAGDARSIMPSLKWVENWLKAEINFLETGKPFEGTITKEMQAGFILGVTYIIFNPVPNVLAGSILGYASSPLIDESSETQKFKVDLLNLPFGSFTLLNSLGLLKHLEDTQTIVDYLTTRDPARFITASFLGIFDVASEQELLKSNGRNNFGLSPEMAGQLKIIAHKFFEQLQIKGFEH